MIDYLQEPRFYIYKRIMIRRNMWWPNNVNEDGYGCAIFSVGVPSQITSRRVAEVQDEVREEVEPCTLEHVAQALE